MMELNTAESITEDIDSEPCHSHDSRDAKVERRRQQNRRNAQAWSKYPCCPFKKAVLG